MSTDVLEFLATSSQTAQQWSACLWDFHSESGNSLCQYKNGGIASARTFSQVGNDYFLTAEHDKPLLHIWPVNSQEPMKSARLILPGPASALAVSPDNTYISVGIGAKLYVWQISSGKLLSVQQKHLLPITCVKFSNNSDYLISACQTGMVVTYNFGDLICLNNSQLAQSEIGQVEPLYSLRDHSGAITDLHVGNFGVKSRFATVSNDHSCRLYELYTGLLLMHLIYDQLISCVILDVPCWQLFLGTNNGIIDQYKLLNPPRGISVHTDTETNNKLNFRGHQGKITCLDINITNEILASGSDDGFVIIWNISSLQIMNKISHRAGVTNLKFITRHDNLFAQTFKPKCMIKTLQRSIDLDMNNFVISVVQKDDIVFSDDEIEPGDSDTNERFNKLEDDLSRARIINKQLYDKLLQFHEKYDDEVNSTS